MQVLKAYGKHFASALHGGTCENRQGDKEQKYGLA